MFRRSIIVFALTLVPALALADNAAGDQTQSAVGASALGPQTNGSDASSTTDGGALQPGGSSLQGSGSDGGSLSAPADQTLQAAPASDQLKVLVSGDADGAPHDTASGSSGLLDSVIAMAVLLALIATIIELRRRTARGRHILIEPVLDSSTTADEGEGENHNDEDTNTALSGKSPARTKKSLKKKKNKKR